MKNKTCLSQRWSAYQMVDKYDLSELNKDFMRNRIVNYSEKRITKMVDSRICKTAYAQLQRCIGDRTRVLGSAINIMHSNVIGG